MRQQSQSKEVKVVLLGDTGVGKSSILTRFVENKFKQGQEPTLGAAFQSQILTYKDTQYKFQIWDTAGQEKYKSLTPLYYRDAHAACIIYDITNYRSFEVLKDWVEELNQRGPANIITAVIGNKEDLIEQEQVDYDESSQYVKQLGAIFKLASAKTGKGIQEVFVEIAEKLQQQDLLKREQQQLEQKTRQPGKNEDQSFVTKLQSQNKKQSSNKSKNCQC